MAKVSALFLSLLVLPRPVRVSQATSPEPGDLDLRARKDPSAARVAVAGFSAQRLENLLSRRLSDVHKHHVVLR